MRRVGSTLTGHVRDLGGGDWELVANLPRRPGKARGQRSTKRIVAKGVMRARKALAAWLTELEQHDCTDPNRVTLGEVLRRWLEAKPGAPKPKTLDRYQELVDRHIVPELGPFVVCELRPIDLTDFYTRKMTSGRLDGSGGLSAQTAKHLHAVIRAALTWAEDEELVDVNPARRVKHPPQPKRVRQPIWDDWQILRAIEEAGKTRMRVPAALAGWAGLRRSEIAALAWDNVDLENGLLRVASSVEQVGLELYFGEPKNANACRPLPMPAPLVELLSEHKARQDAMRLAAGPSWNTRNLVCCRADGQPSKPETLSTGWAQFVRQHKLEPRITFHGLRRSYLSLLHADGAPDRLIMDRAGHAALSTTHNHYLFTFGETDVAFLHLQEARIEAARASLAQVCQSRASAPVSLASARESREG